MSFRRIEFVGLLVVLSIVAFAIIFISIDMVNSDAENRLEEVSTSGRISGTEIYRDDYGIAYIKSDDELKAYYALGYLHAKDRLFQLDFIRKSAEGRLAELYGRSHIEYDKFIRAFALDSLARKQFENASDHTRKTLAFYTEGINQYISDHRGEYPMEFGLYDSSPEQWQPHIPFMIYNYHAFTASKNIYGDMVFSAMRNSIPLDRLRKILGNSQYEQINMPFFEEEQPDSLKADSLSTITPDSIYTPTLIDEITGEGACNLLAYSLWRDSVRESILMNEMHSSLLLPQKYYPVSLSFGNKNIIGLGLVGTPILMTGRNDNFAWGRTYLQGDDINYHRLSVDENKMVYSWEEIPKDSTLSRLELRVDTLRIKDEPEEYYYQRIVEGRHLLPSNRVVELLGYHGGINSLKIRQALLPVWAMSDSSDNLGIYLRIASADSLSSTMADWEKASLPLEYIAFADKNGDLAQIRMGDTLSHQAHIIDKDLSYSKISSANSEFRIQRDSGYIVSSSFEKEIPNSIYYSDDSRKERLEDLMDESVRFTYREADMISQDMFSGYYYELAKSVIGIVEDNTRKQSSALKRKIKLLKEWNGIATVESFEYRMLNQIVERLHLELISQKLDSRISHYLWKQGISDRIILNILTDDENRDIFSVDEGTLTKMLVKAIEGFEEKEDYVRTFTLPSTFAGIDNDTNLLDDAYKIEVGEIRGSMHSVAYLNLRDTVPHGAAFRFIADMGTDKVQLSMPSGTSGKLVSDYYDNLFQYWKIGGSITLPLYPEYDKLIREVTFN